MAETDDTKGSNRANIAQDGNGPRPPDSTRYFYEVPKAVWEEIREALGRTAATSREDVDDQIASIRAALTIGLAAAGELERVREVIDAATKYRAGFTLNEEFIPRDTFGGYCGELIGNFAEALAMLDCLRASGLRTVEACRASRKVKEAACA